MLKQALSSINNIFPSEIINQANAVCFAGGVLNCRFSEGLIKATVKDPGGNLCVVHIDLKSWPSRSGQCSCHKIQPCLHVCASLLSLQAKMGLQTDVITTALLPNYNFKISSLQNLQDLQDLQDLQHDITNLDDDLVSYDLKLVIGEHTIQLVPLLMQFLSQHSIENIQSYPLDQVFTIQLKLSGKTQNIAIPWRKLKPIVDCLIYYGNKNLVKDNKLQLTKYQLVNIQAMHAYYNSTDFQNLWKTLNENNDVEDVVIPKGLKIDLRRYQLQGIHWLEKLRLAKMGGILADDMGLGKTIQTLTHLLNLKEKNLLTLPSLIVVPTSLVYNWQSECEKYTPDLQMILFHGSNREINIFNKFDILLTTYGMIQRNMSRFEDLKFEYLIVDEAQFIKNRTAQRSQFIKDLKANYRLCITGTPIENHIGELWTLFDIVMPGFLGSYAQLQNYLKQRGDEGIDLLSKRIKPFILRRTKSEVAQDLPAKTEIIEWVEFDESQREWYQSIKMTLNKELSGILSKIGFNKGYIFVLDILLKLRQLCCHPALLPKEMGIPDDLPSAKFNTWLWLVKNLIAENRKVLVFSQFTSMIDIMARALDQESIQYLKLTGKTTKRNKLIEQFQQGNIPVFLISLKAGGVGLNLTAADTVIHYDPWWNPAVESQATDRTHRLGQNKPVFVYKLIVKDSVEEGILSLHERKKQLIHSILSATNTKTPIITQEELKLILGIL